MSSRQLGRDLKLVEKELGADLSVNPSGDLQTISEEYNLAQAVINAFRTREGELGELGHSLYGSRLPELIGEPNNERTRALAKSYARESLLRDPRIKEILSIVVNVSKDDPNRIDLSISVLPINKTTALNIVYPFHLEVT